MKYLFQFARILGFCLAGEALHTLVPLPIPGGVWGLVLLLLALKTGLVKLEQVKQTGHFLVGIMPLLFVPAAVGVMELGPELLDMLLPVIVALVPITILVMGVSGKVTEFLAKKTGGKPNG